MSTTSEPTEQIEQRAHLRLVEALAELKRREDARRERILNPPITVTPIDWTAPYVPPKRLFYFDRVGGKDWVTVLWGGYDYDIEMDRIPDPLALLQWIAHMGEKTWEGMTSDEIAAFIDKVCKRKGWDLWGKHH